MNRKLITGILKLWCLSILLLILHAKECLTADCMTGSAVLASTVISDKCYWTHGAKTYTTWQSAIKLCKDMDGEIGSIISSQDNTLLAAWITKTTFIGYAKDIADQWAWVNSASTFTNTFTENSGVHMTLKVDGTWEPSNVDATGHLNAVLCEIDHQQQNCSTIAPTNAIQSMANPMYAGDEVTVTCRSGFHVYVGKTIQTATCLPGNRWSSPPIWDCEAIKCDLFEPLAYTKRNSELHIVGAEVQYNCTDEHTYFAPGVRSKDFICRNDGEWDPPLEPCRFIRCDKPPALDMGVFDNSLTLYGNTITYSCLLGYAFSDGSTEKTITCGGNPPEWDNPTALQGLACLEISCPEDATPGQFSPAYQHNVGRQVGYRQIHFCFDGMEYKNGQVGTVATCLEEPVPALPGNDWDLGIIPDCYNIRCSATNTENVTKSLDLEEYERNNVVIMICPEQFYFPGGYSQLEVECLPNGQWDFEPATSGCDETKCESGWLEYAGSCYYLSNPNGMGLRYEYAEIQCGYRHAHLAVIESAEEAAWIGTVTYDVSEKDFWIGYHKNNDGDWVWKGDFQTPYLNWADGYPERFDCSRTSVDGWWKDRHCDDFLPYICKKVSICGQAPKVAFGSAVNMPIFPVNAGTNMTFRCDDGYIFSDRTREKNITCMIGGFFSEIGNCVPVLCERLNLALDLHETYFDESKSEIGTKITFTCQNGFLFEDTGLRTHEMECLETGEWSSLPEHCEEIECPMPASPDTTGESNVNHYGAMDYYKCEPGFSFPDGEIDKLFSCQIDGTWEPKGQYCIPRACPKYSLPFAKSEPDEGVYKEEITVTCYKGYEFPDTAKQKTLTCTVNGVWSEDLHPCLLTKCEGPTPPNVTNAHRSTDEITAGTAVTYACIEPYVFINGDTQRSAECDIETLTWVNVPTPCVEAAAIVVHEHYHPPEEAANASTYGTIGFAFVGTFIAAIVVFDLIGIKRYLAHCGTQSNNTDNGEELEVDEEAPHYQEE